MKNKLLLGLATATILAVGSDALINTSINQPQVLLAAKTKIGLYFKIKLLKIVDNTWLRVEKADVLGD